MLAWGVILRSTVLFMAMPRSPDYIVIRGNVYGNARIKRHSDLYSVPINCEVYESDDVIKIDKQNK